MIEESRIQSPVRGLGEPLINMSYVSNDDEVKLGEHVVTNGMDSHISARFANRHGCRGEAGRSAVQIHPCAAVLRAWKKWKK